MIKFFHRFRQNLIAESRFGKYLLYAIGEIVLVVIGILIALSINNWNDNRKKKQQELVVVNQLIEDTTSDSMFFNQRLDFFTKYCTSLENILALSKNDSVLPLSLQKYTVAHGPMFVHFVYQSYVVNNKLDVINYLSSESLKHELKIYELRHSFVSGAILVLNDKNDNLAAKIDREFYQKFGVLDSTITYRQVKDFFSNPEIQGVAHELNMSSANAINQTKNFLDENSRLMGMLKQNKAKLKD